MRKRATEGTKISTSPSITKKIVRTRRRADRLCSSTVALASAEARQQADEPPGARRKQGGRIEAAGRALARLAARRVRHDKIGQSADLELLRNRQGPGEYQIPGPGAENRGAEDAPVAPGDDLDQSHRIALGLGTVVLVKAPAQDAHRAICGARGGFGQSDLGKFGIGVSDPRQRPVIDLRGEAEQRVPDDDSGMIESDVSELRPAGDIADRKSPAVGGAQPRIDRDALRGRHNSGGRKIECLGVRPPPRSDQEMRAGDPRAIRKIDVYSLFVALDPNDLDLRVSGNTLGGKSLGEAGREFGIVARK